MTQLYSCYEFEVYPDYEASYDLLNRDPNISSTKWVYTILLNDPERKFWTGEDSIESDEWFDSEQEARFAAIGHIDRLEDGPDEPDYDAPTAKEMYQRAHEDRQQLRG